MVTHTHTHTHSTSTTTQYHKRQFDTHFSYNTFTHDDDKIVMKTLVRDDMCDGGDQFPVCDVTITCNKNR